jgi:hypothetical protein
MPSKTSDLLKKLMQAFDGSATLGDDGLPRRMYHATSNDFDTFSNERLGGVTNHPTARLGHFFSESPSAVDVYARDNTGMVFSAGKDYRDGGAIMPTYLNIKNPHVMDAADFRNALPVSTTYNEGYGFMKTPEQIDAFKKELQAKGHDGIRIVGDQKGKAPSPGLEEWIADQWVAFEPNQIKSAFNDGTFDPTSPNILKSSLPYALAGGGLMAAMSPSQAQAIDRIRQNDLPLEDAWNPIEAFGGGLGGGLKAAATGVLPDGAMDWAFNKLGGLMSGGR